MLKSFLDHPYENKMKTIRQNNCKKYCFDKKMSIQVGEDKMSKLNQTRPEPNQAVRFGSVRFYQKN